MAEFADYARKNGNAAVGRSAKRCLVFSSGLGILAKLLILIGIHHGSKSLR
jgi:hypothetical protein